MIKGGKSNRLVLLLLTTTIHSWINIVLFTILKKNAQFKTKTKNKAK